MKIKKDICENIFREYDIRGVYPDEFDEDTAYTIGLGFGSYLRKVGKKICIVGKDNRLSSPILYNFLIKGILETGIDVIGLDLCTTPMFYYACIKLDIYSGLMITASHNPKDDNGLKFCFDKSGNCKGKQIKDFLAFIKRGDFLEGKGTLYSYNILEEYIKLFKSSLDFGDRRIKVVIDPANGTTSDFVRYVYGEFPLDITYINDKSDGNFPNHHPDPCVESSLDQLKKKVLELGADVGISFDGDGDRMGLVTNSGIFIPTDYYMSIIVKNIIDNVKNKQFLYDVKCSKTFTDEVRKLGGEAICCRAGASYTKAMTRDLDLPFGGEFSGHVYFRDRWPGFDSGFYAGLRFLEVMSKCDKSADELFIGLNKYFSTPEIKISSSDDKKFSVVDKVKKYVIDNNYSYIDIDGVRVLFDDGWALVRCSNTGPNITARFEASSEERLYEIKEEFINVINEYNNF